MLARVGAILVVVAVVGSVACASTSDTCDAGYTKCGDVCIDPSIDALNCGGCAGVLGGLDCTKTNQGCSGGTCVDVPCPAGDKRCGAECIDLRFSDDNCGACGNKCTGESTIGIPNSCINGKCNQG